MDGGAADGSRKIEVSNHLYNRLIRSRCFLDNRTKEKLEKRWTRIACLELLQADSRG